MIRNPERELGWFPVCLTQQGRIHRFFRDFPGTFTALLWHGDTFSIPHKCIHAAENEGCINQAFACEDAIVGLQFHLEITRDYLQRQGLFSSEDLAPGKFVQRPEQMNDPAVLAANSRSSSRLLAGLCDRLSGFYP
ncbi:MAG: hypothetical protein EHM28_04490 [Spirochaetaceae bacterium]|nr:MAG: hypothetical protein EHM28_04490 [Spirochaetaceae bacterium]